MAIEVSDMLSCCQVKSYHDANFFKLPDCASRFKNRDMQKNQDEYLCFLTALKHKIRKEGRGSQQRVAIDADISKAYLSQLMSGVRRASFQTQVAIAKSFSFDYYKFLEFGEKLLANKSSDEDAIAPGKKEGTPKLHPIQQEHKGLIDRFINKETAYDINKKLLEIEKADPNKFKEIQDYVDFIYQRIESKKIANGNSE